MAAVLRWDDIIKGAVNACGNMDIVNTSLFKEWDYGQGVSDIPSAGNMFICRDTVTDDKILADL